MSPLPFNVCISLSLRKIKEILSVATFLGLCKQTTTYYIIIRRNENSSKKPKVFKNSVCNE